MIVIGGVSKKAPPGEEMNRVWLLLLFAPFVASAWADSTIREFPGRVVVEITGKPVDNQGAEVGSAAGDSAERVTWLQGELGRLRGEALTLRSGKAEDTPEETRYRLVRREELAGEIGRYSDELISLKENRQPESSGSGN